MNKANGHGFEVLGGNPGDRSLECVLVERTDHLAVVVEPFGHCEPPASAHQGCRTFLVHIVKPHQPQPADFKQIAKTFRRNQSGTCTAALNYGVCRDGRAMNQLVYVSAGYACLLQHVPDTSEDCLCVIAAR